MWFKVRQAIAVGAKAYQTRKCSKYGVGQDEEKGKEPENEGKIPVVLIEAQVGEYTGEDDIVRIEDDFDRIHD